jgi:hypothetical protein
LAFEQLVHLPRVGLAFGGFHGLADEEAEHLAALGFVGGAVLFDLLGVGASISSSILSIAPVSVTCFRPCFR